MADIEMAGAEVPGAWMVWQIVDSGLPTGGFAHSLGLEAAASLGHVVSPEVGRHQKAVETATPGVGLKTFVGDQLESLAAQELPFVHEAHVDPGRWEALDELLAVRLQANPSALSAATAQGSAFLRIAASGMAGSAEARDRLEAMREAVTAGRARGVMAPVFGAVTRLLGIGRVEAQRMYLFLALRDMVSAAKRLALVGPMAGVQLQTSLGARLDACVAKYADLPVEGAHQTNPVGDILHACHGSLYRKLFLS